METQTVKAVDIHEKWRLEKEEKIKQLNFDLSQIAKIVGGTLRVESEPWEHGGRIDFADGSGLWVSADWHRRKYKVSGQWPLASDRRGMDPRSWNVIPYGETEPTMGFSMSRDPSDIGNTVKKRFLPEYQRLYTLCLEAKAKEDKYFADKAGILERLSKLGGELWVHTDGREPSLQINDSRSYTTVKSSSDSVSMDIRYISEDKAAAIVKILTTN